MTATTDPIIEGDVVSRDNRLYFVLSVKGNKIDVQRINTSEPSELQESSLFTRCQNSESAPGHCWDCLCDECEEYLI